MNCSLCKSGFDFTMIGGDTEKIVFEAMNEYANVADISGCTATFSICRYDERYNDMAIHISDVLISNNAVIVNFKHEDTIDLHGKYIWQLSIYEPNIKKLASAQGSVTIFKNIDVRIVGD